MYDNACSIADSWKHVKGTGDAFQGLCAGLCGGAAHIRARDVMGVPSGGISVW